MKKIIFSFFNNNLIANSILLEQYDHFKKLKSFLNKNNINIKMFTGNVSDDTDAIIYFDMIFPWKIFIWKQIFKNRDKNILFIFEPPIVNPFNYFKFLHIFFKKVYTWNDDLIDNKKYFKFYWQQLNFGINIQKKSFQEKKFLILINGNKISFTPFRIISKFGKELYLERIKSIKYFEKNIPEKFSLYGKGWNKAKKFNLKEKLFGFKKYKTYKGEIDNKIELLSNFKYCLCFENLTNVNGYITEKIFDCFKAKCVPIYWGASNIKKCIPKDCFIDYRDFMSYEKLLNHLENIDENEYNQYMKNIEKLLVNKDFLDVWFEDGWANFFLKVVKEI